MYIYYWDFFYLFSSISSLLGRRTDFAVIFERTLTCLVGYLIFNPIEISDIDWISSRHARGRLLDHPVYLCFQLNRLLCTLFRSLLAACGKGRRSVGLHVIQVNIRGIRTSSHPSSFVYSVPLYPSPRRSSPYLVSSKSFNEKDLGFTRH